MPTQIINFHMCFICGRVSFSFLAKGGQNEIVWTIGGGKHLFMCKACGKQGVRGMLPQGNFDFGLFIRHNLVESGTVFAQTIICHLCVIILLLYM